jgi:hypothetical protein
MIGLARPQGRFNVGRNESSGPTLPFVANFVPTMLFRVYMRMRWILVAVLAMYVAGCKPGKVRRVEELAARVRSVVKPEELQAWATNLIARTPFEGRDSVKIKPSDVPQFVHAIYGEDPEMVFIHHSDTGNFIEIWYGGGFGHWGIDVGPPTFQGIENPNFYVVPWKPGIYFWAGP